MYFASAWEMPASSQKAHITDWEQLYEPFHRQDFFFINYAYQNSYAALSAKDNRLITIGYIGQPYSGYALRGAAADKEEIIIIGILIQRDAFFRNYLPIIYADASLFRFFSSQSPIAFPMSTFIFPCKRTLPSVSCWSLWSWNTPTARKIPSIS